MGLFALGLTTLLALAIAMPIFLAIFAGVLAYFFIGSTLSPMVAMQRLMGGGQNLSLLAIPFFILLGAILNSTGITPRILKLADLLVGRFQGGLAHANILLSTLMGGLSASNLADCAMLTKMLVPEMEKQGYSRAFSTVVTSFGAQITPIIPPGIGLIIYGFLADVSIGKMFMAGILPGIMCCFMLMGAVAWVANKRDYKPTRTGPTPQGYAGKTLLGALPGLSLIVIIIGGIRAGIFTPTEAGAVAVIYVIIIGALVHREMKLTDLMESLWETAGSTASIMLIIMACSALGWVFTWEKVAQDIAQFLTTSIPNATLFLICLNVFLLFLGMFMEGNAILIVMVPLLKPTAVAFGVDLVHFGLIIIFNLAIGTITPPVGTVALLSTSISKTPLADYYRESAPFFIALVGALIIVTFCPIVSTFLPTVLW
jgi:tripartite ATP-independent transporter DctM subunit